MKTFVIWVFSSLAMITAFNSMSLDPGNVGHMIFVMIIGIVAAIFAAGILNRKANNDKGGGR